MNKRLILNKPRNIVTKANVVKKNTRVIRKRFPFYEHVVDSKNEEPQENKIHTYNIKECETKGAELCKPLKEHAISPRLRERIKHQVQVVTSEGSDNYKEKAIEAEVEN